MTCSTYHYRKMQNYRHIIVTRWSHWVEMFCRKGFIPSSRPISMWKSGYWNMSVQTWTVWWQLCGCGYCHLSSFTAWEDWNCGSVLFNSCFCFIIKIHINNSNLCTLHSRQLCGSAAVIFWGEEWRVHIFFEHTFLPALLFCRLTTAK